MIVGKKSVLRLSQKCNDNIRSADLFNISSFAILIYKIDPCQIITDFLRNNDIHRIAGNNNIQCRTGIVPFYKIIIAYYPSR